jgi:hypothetical protein
MGQMGEDQQATPDVAAPLKWSPSVSSAPYDVASPLPRESAPSQLPWAFGTFCAHLAPMHVTDLAVVVEDLCPPSPLIQP